MTLEKTPLENMYQAIVNSPDTRLLASINSVVTTVGVQDIDKLPNGPNLAVISPDIENPETILYMGKSGNNLTGVVRGFQGTAQDWPINTIVSRVLTAYDINTFITNILGLDDKKIEKIVGDKDLVLFAKNKHLMQDAQGFNPDMIKWSKNFIINSGFEWYDKGTMKPMYWEGDGVVVEDEKWEGNVSLKLEPGQKIKQIISPF
jgi:hypothetical protein